MKEFTFKISEEAYQLLLSIKKEGYAEYRDPRYEDVEEFKADIDNHMSVDSFLDRNHNGTYYIISELLKYNLVDTSDDSWHITYILSDFGKELVSDASLREDKINKILEK